VFNAPKQIPQFGAKSPGVYLYQIAIALCWVFIFHACLQKFRTNRKENGRVSGMGRGTGYRFSDMYGED
jgi:hypothetical protein